MFIFCIYMLCSSIKLLRRFVLDHSTHHSNEKAAWMHIILIALIFCGSTFFNLTTLWAHISSLQDDKTVTDFKRIILIGRMTKYVCQFVGCMMLIWMLTSLAGSAQKETKSRS